MRRSSRRPRSRSSASASSAGNIVELFSGIQGEGVHVGRRQLFLRLAGCPFGCAYCDQPEARRIPRHALIEETRGRRDFLKVPNPIPAHAVLCRIRALLGPDGLHHAIALTGGEPLMQPDFLAALLPGIRRIGLRVMLETNGTEVRAFRRLRRWVDIVSMDFKLRSATGRPMPLRSHREFLRLAVGGTRETYVKLVLTSRSARREVARVAAAVAAVSPEIPVILQPVTPTRRGMRPPSPGRLLEWQETAARRLKNARVIPQTHRLIGQR